MKFQLIPFCSKQAERASSAVRRSHRRSLSLETLDGRILLSSTRIGDAMDQSLSLRQSPLRSRGYRLMPPAACSPRDKPPQIGRVMLLNRT